MGNKSDLFGDKREEIINLGEEFSEEIDITEDWMEELKQKKEEYKKSKEGEL